MMPSYFELDQALAFNNTQDEKNDKPIYDKFRSLIVNTSGLIEALAANPNLIQEKDEEGMTLLHHAANIGRLVGTQLAGELLKVLFAIPGLNFHIKDHRGNTPVHTAAIGCEHRVTYQSIFPQFLKKALEHGFDFSTLNNEGESVLHIATKISYDSSVFGRLDNVSNMGNCNVRNMGNCNVRNMDNCAPKPKPRLDVFGLDVLSSSGSTALSCAIDALLFNEANTLLEAGANPLLCGSPELSPLRIIEKHLKTFTSALNQPAYPDDILYIKEQIKELQRLEQDIVLKVKKVQADSCEEIKKNAYTLYEVSIRISKDSFFCMLPTEILTRIAADTQTAPIDCQSRKEAEEIAAEEIAAAHAAHFASLLAS
jgi:ankyrin repeat protein